MKRKGFKKPLHTFTCLGTILLLLASCIAKNDVSVKVKRPSKNQTTTSKPVTVSNIQVVNHQIIITGTNLDSVQQFKIKEGSSNTTLQIESKTATTIVANTISNVTFAAGKILDFIFSNAEAAATFTVNFSLCDSSLGGKAFNCTITPNDKEVLSYDAASGKWQPRAVNGLSYIGTFDASGGANPATKPAGQYYIVSVAGDIDAGATILGVGDWIVSNGTSWQKIDNSTVITSVHGRTGAVVGDEGDYTLTQLNDVTLTAPINNQILKYNGTAWVNSDLSALGGGTVTSVSGIAPISVANGTSTPAISISQANTTTNGYLSSADWNTFNSKQASITAGTNLQYYRGDKSWQTLDTLAVPENINLYFTNARALGVPLTGFATDTNAIVATDTILQAFGKAQGQIDNLTLGGSNYLLKNGADTVTGQVTVHAATGALKIPTTPSGVDLTDAVNVQYVNTYADNKVAKSGDTMTGDLQINTKIKLQDSGTNTVSLQAPTTITASYVLKLPTALGTNNQVLTTDAAGNLSWTSPATSTAPNGSAGGELSGTYPNPTIAGNAITDSHIAANAISQSKINGLTTALSGKEPTITAGTTAQYLRGDKTLSTFADDVLATLLTGFSTATNAVVTATDSVLVAFGKLQAQISANTTSIGNKADQTNLTQTITAATVTGLIAPVAGVDATSKTYVDTQIAGAANQWGESGGNVYRSTGNVGIGMINPTNSLDVEGNIRVGGAGSVANSRLKLQNTSDSYANLSAPSVYSSGSTGAAYPFLASGNLVLEPRLSGAVRDVVVMGATATPVAVFQGSGNVGIGTTSPSSVLQVTKDQDALSRILITNANNSASAQSQLGLTAGGTIGGMLSVFPSASTHPFGAGRVLLSSGSQTEGVDIFTEKATGDFNIRTGSSYASRFYVSSSGNVGIGTTTPAHKLSVQGNQSILTNDYVSGTTGSALFLARGASTGNTYSLIQAYYDGGTTYAPLALNPNGGNVGIGTTTPWTKLDVSGSGSAQAASIQAANTLDSAGEKAYIRSYVQGPNSGNPVFRAVVNGVTEWSWGIDNADSDKFKIAKSGDVGLGFDKFTIDVSGNVGIGTAAPELNWINQTPGVAGSKFFTLSGGSSDIPAMQVLRDTNSAFGGYFNFMKSRLGAPANALDEIGYLNFNILNSASKAKGIASIVGRVDDATDGSEDGRITFRTMTAGSSNDNMVIVGGNVGIGTTNPSANLDIGGNGQLWIRQGGGGGFPISAGAGLKIEAIAAGARIESYDYSTSTYKNLILQGGSGGNVGIGTTAPGAPLDVVGAGSVPMRLRKDSGSTYWHVGPDGANAFVVYNQGGTGMYIANGATTWTANSDRRIKRNIELIPLSLSKLMQISGVTYWYKSEAENEPRRVGVIAQDVQKVLPEAVSEKNGILGVRYQELIPLVINAVKELYYKFIGHDKQLTTHARQIASIEALKADKADIEAKFKKLEVENAQLKIRLEKIEQALSRQ